MSIKVGVIGTGIMGSRHIGFLRQIPERFEVTALCDTDEAKLRAADAQGAALFADYRKLVDSGLCQAVVVATPHPCHAEISEYALKHGLHCLCEKPLSETVAKIDALIRAAAESGKVFCTNFSMRTQARVKKVREWMVEKRLGDIIRVDCVCTRWLRAQAYYEGQAWRGSWQGEGGGILMNQTPHNLDLLYHWFGEMKSVTARLSIRMHDIEVEDEVYAVIQTKAGFPIRFYANTGEAPGEDRVEIVCDRGTLITSVDQDGQYILLRRLDQSVSEMLAGEAAFPEAHAEEEELSTAGFSSGGAKEIWENFADAIEQGKPLLAPGAEGIHAVELANAMTLSHFTKRDVELPVDRQEYDALLAQLRNGQKSLKEQRL